MKASLAFVGTAAKPPAKYRWALDPEIRIELEDADRPRITVVVPEEAVRGLTWLLGSKADLRIELFQAPEFNLLRVRLGHTAPRSTFSEGMALPKSVRYAHELHAVAWSHPVELVVVVLKRLDALSARRLAAKATLTGGVKLVFAERGQPENACLLAKRPLILRDLAAE